MTVYLRSGNSATVIALHRAKLVASRIFASIDVPIQWRTGTERRAAGADEVSIELLFESGLPVTFHPGALAYAMPYATGGARIHVFCDRVIGSSSPELAAAFLGHVIAHEVTHVIQGVSRHSTEGVMQAHWNKDDISQMLLRPLQFATEDADFIRGALKRQ